MPSPLAEIVEQWFKELRQEDFDWSVLEILVKEMARREDVFPLVLMGAKLGLLPIEAPMHRPVDMPSESRMANISN